VLEPFLQRGVAAAAAAEAKAEGAGEDAAAAAGGGAAAAGAGAGRMSARRVADRAVRHVTNALNALVVAGTSQQRQRPPRHPPNIKPSSTKTVLNTTYSLASIMMYRSYQVADYSLD